MIIPYYIGAQSMDKITEDFLKHSNIKTSLKGMDNNTICKMILTHVWCSLDSTSIEAALLGEAIHRLKEVDKKYDCSAWHEANQDKDDICCYCNKPLNPDF